MGDLDRLMIDALPAAFIAIDRSGAYIVFNPAAEQLIGTRPKPGERAGEQSFVELLHTDGETPLRRDELPLVRALSGEQLVGLEVVFRNANISQGRWIACSAGPLRDASGEIIGAAALMYDITAQVEARRQLQRTERMLERSQKMEALGRLAGSVAHDFNNLITVIQSYAHLLETELDPNDARRDDATEIRRAAERAGAVTRQLLSMSRHSVVQPRSLDLDELLGGIESLLRRLIDDQIQLVIVRGSLPSVLADPGQIEQVLMNLVVNARDAMPAGGRITVELQALELDEDGGKLRGVTPGGYVMLAVTDTGTGMDEATQRRIFEPFFTTKEVGRGTGLGLSIVHGIVAQAGGAITVYSELGRGTTFRIFLPVGELAGEAAQVRAEIAVRDSLPAVTILVIENDDQVRAVTTRILESAGALVLEAAGAEEARQVCVREEGPIDLVLSDIALPDGQGQVLVKQLLELRPSLKVLLMSGHPAGALTRAEMPSWPLLAKPFTPAELRMMVGAQVAPPLDDDDATPATSSRSIVAIGAIAAPTVLLVDDDVSFRRGVLRFLTAGGFVVTEAGGGAEAVAILKSQRFDVVVSDIQMPDFGGLDLLRAIRGVDLDIPVILITGMPDTRSAAQAVEYGAFRYLTKPPDFDALVASVRHASRAHKLARIRRDAFAAGGTHTHAAADRAGLEVRFDNAYDRLWMAFQPIVDARTSALFGVEALLRTDEPSMPGPMAFVDAATELGRLPLLGRRVRALAAAGIAERTGLVLFVNLHPDDLADADLVDPAAPLSRIASRVVLEVTERASLRVSPTLTARLARLREMGFRLAVDDIGAGYSGLSSFTELMPEIVKIDMSLVRDVHVSPVKQRTVRSLCSLCHEIGSTVVGEGVETEAERDALRELGIDLFQGYYFGRPARVLPTGR